MGSIGETLRAYILREFLPDVPAEELTDDVRLIDDRILDSIAVLRLRSFLEERFGVELEAHELDFEHFNSIPGLEALVASKLPRSA